jgi:hypothetical protein
MLMITFLRDIYFNFYIIITILNICIYIFFSSTYKENLSLCIGF